MTLTGPRKAALLLMSLDPTTAAELLKSAQPETVQEVAAEVACLREMQQTEPEMVQQSIREFVMLLRGKGGGGGEGNFLQSMLDNLVGQQESPRLMEQVQQRVMARDPFAKIRPVPVEKLAVALAGESPQVVSIVLAELSATRSSELLQLLDANVRGPAVACMTGGKEVPADARLRVATIVQARLDEAEQNGEEAETPAAADPAGRTKKLRKVALLLRSMEVEARAEMSASLQEQDPEAAEEVNNLMVIWEDVLGVGDRNLQEALRAVDSTKLALALYEADEAIVAKLRDNISERAKAMLDEESSLLSSPKTDDVNGAREVLLNALREMNSKGELQFEQEQ